MTYYFPDNYFTKFFERIKMKRFLAVVSLVGLMVLGVPSIALAAPNENASHVAKCATTMGGQHVAQCAQAMEQGVSQCAQMSGPCDMHE